MKEQFDIKRFGTYFAYDLNRSVTRYGLTALIVGLMPVLLLVFGFVFSFIFGGDGLDSASVYNSWPIAAYCILVMSFGPRVWGAVTDRKLGTEWITLPASASEKTLSMLLVTCVVLPVVMLVLLSVGNVVVSLFIPDVEPIFSLKNLVKINEFNILGDDGPFFNFPLVLWLSWCESILVFTLGALCFKRNKVGKTLLCCMGLGFLLSLLAMLFFKTTQLDYDAIEQFLGEFDAARAQVWINVALNLMYTVVFVLLIGGLYARIKTIKA